MLVRDFHFDLPDGLIADYPASERDASRLMVLYLKTGQISDNNFCNIGEYLRSGDLLVMNSTRVIPARLFGKKQTGGRVEIFLVEPDRGQDAGVQIWNCLLRSSKQCRSGQIISLADGVMAEVLERLPNRDDEEVPIWQIKFSGVSDFQAWLESSGEMPIPPYIGRPGEALDRIRYQTVYADHPGAVAAPTAGLHFTPELLEKLRKDGVNFAKLVLHVGLGTFQPVRVERVQDHRIHREKYIIPETTARAIAETKAAGGRIVAVGTTTARTLEYAANDMGQVIAGNGEADIFIYPGYRFKVVDALITNFHLPESTLLMLVSAFAGQNFVKKAYEEAVRQKFRFYSYGDAMLIV